MRSTDKKKTERIRKAVHACRKCEGIVDPRALCINQKEIGIDYIYPRKTPINILFVAESPPKPSNGFFYDLKYTDHMFRNKLFKLINESGLGPVGTLDDFTDSGYYLADSLNCRWDKSIKKYLPVGIFQNCSLYLAQQIELFKPKFIVAMGNKASNSLSYPYVEEAISKANIPDDNIIRMSFILVAPNETDAQRVEKLVPIADRLSSTPIPMKKTMRVSSRHQLDECIREVDKSAKVTQNRLRGLPNESVSGLQVLHTLKFQPKGCNPLNQGDLNLIEQLNQTFTYLASFKAVEYLLEKHPNEDSFTLNLGEIMGHSIFLKSIKK